MKNINLQNAKCDVRHFIDSFKKNESNLININLYNHIHVTLSKKFSLP